MLTRFSQNGDLELVKAGGQHRRSRQGMTELVKQAGLGRVSLYKALSPNGNPEFATVTRILNTLGPDFPLRSKPQIPTLPGTGRRCDCRTRAVRLAIST
jgi:probable addiction module antidote protein